MRLRELRPATIRSTVRSVFTAVSLQGHGEMVIEHGGDGGDEDAETGFVEGDNDVARAWSQ